LSSRRARALNVNLCKVPSRATPLRKTGNRFSVFEASQKSPESRLIVVFITT
jgi:hypothetical protein